jgi:hypothetical protein
MSNLSTSPSLGLKRKQHGECPSYMASSNSFSAALVKTFQRLEAIPPAYRQSKAVSKADNYWTKPLKGEPSEVSSVRLGY